MDLLKRLKKSDLIKTGNFILKSGQQSNIYFDFKGLVSYPKLVSDISYELSKMVSGDDVCVAGVPIGGLPYSIMISQIKNLPMIMIREDKKKYGTCNQIEGLVCNKKIVLIEDVITTGQSVINILKILESNNIMIDQIICILDRNVGGRTNIINRGFKVKSLYTICNGQIVLSDNDACSNILDNNCLKIKNHVIRNLVNIVNKKKSNLIVSLDVTNTQELLDKLSLLGDHICAVKIHYDIIENISFNDEAFVSNLVKLKTEQNFMIIEDRKFADIPSITAKQLHFVRKYADIITVHGIVGEKMIEEINGIGLGILLVHQLSIENNLIDNIYSNKIKDLGLRFDNVVGFVGQEKVSDEYLTFTPGVNMMVSIEKNTEGQTYRSVIDCHTDLFIVGRAIYNSPDIVETTKNYKSACFGKWKHH